MVRTSLHLFLLISAQDDNAGDLLLLIRRHGRLHLHHQHRPHRGRLRHRILPRVRPGHLIESFQLILLSGTIKGFLQACLAHQE